MPSSKKVGTPTIYIDSKSKKRYVKIGGRRIWLPEDVTRKNLMKFLADRRKRKSVSKKKKKPGKKVVIKKKIVRVAEGLRHPDTAWQSRAISVNLPNTQGDRKMDEEKIIREVQKMIKPSKSDALVVIPKGGDDIIEIDGVKMSKGDLARYARQFEQRKNKETEEADKKAVKAVLEKEKAEWKALRGELKEKITQLREQYVQATTAALTKEAARQKGRTLYTYLTKKAKDYGIPKGNTVSMLPQVMTAMLADRKESREFPEVKKLLQELESTAERLKELDENPPIIAASPSPSPPPRIPIEDVQEDEHEKKSSPSIANKFARLAKKMTQRSDRLAAIDEDESYKRDYYYPNLRNEAIMRDDDDLMRDINDEEPHNVSYREVQRQKLNEKEGDLKRLATAKKLEEMMRKLKHHSNMKDYKTNPQLFVKKEGLNDELSEIMDVPQDQYFSLQRTIQRWRKTNRRVEGAE
jgi:hypothetical protein